MARQSDSQEVEELDWGSIYKGLFVYCRRHGLPLEDAKEMAQEAICRAVDPRRRRDPEKYPTVPIWLGSIVNGLLVNRRRNVAARTETLVKEMPVTPAIGIAGLSGAPARPDGRVINADKARRAVTKVLERLKGDTTAEAIVFLEADGLDKPRQQAKELEVDVQQVYRAREKVANATAQVVKEMEED